ncbi:MAG: hypothetical protein M3P82_01165 [Bacteroidota bacterium]|nr:hypothetical protein [Bacteroidota bacterium]
MKITLLGFTGLGNAVLKGLLKNKEVIVSSVFTKRYDLPYPYYDEIQMETMCSQNNLKCYIDKQINSKDVIDSLKKEQPDLIWVASFNQILSKEVIEIPKRGIINFHPSLLPKYRGPYPDQAALLNGESKTGVTVHYLTEEPDSGNIIYQSDLDILPDDNYSTLKKNIAGLTEEIIPDVIRLFENNSIPEGIMQNEHEMSYFTKLKLESTYLERENDIITIKNKVRALNPFPGTSILIDGHRVEVNKFELLNIPDIRNDIIEEEDFVDMYLDRIGIRLFKKK